MSCTLSIIGEHLDIDAFEKRCGLTFEKKTYKGTPRYKTKPDSEPIPYSILSTCISDADFNSLNEQIEDVISYLQKHHHKLIHILAEKDIQYASLNFGINFDPGKWTFSTYLPANLVALAGNLGLGIEISNYNEDMFE